MQFCWGSQNPLPERHRNAEWSKGQLGKHRLPKSNLVGEVSGGKLFWSNHCNWLKDSGYLLRPRYQEGWTSSHSEVIDATAITDGSFVMMKCVKSPTNHCAPILEVLKHPNEAGWAIIVMPLLRSYDKPCFDLRVRNCMSTNIMMGGASLYHILFHPIKQDHKHDFSGSVHPSKTCTQHLVKYYLTDFNLSRRYKLEDHPPLEATIRGRDQTAPKIDTSNVYYLGNLIWHDFLVVPHLYSFPISNILQSWDITSQKFGFEFIVPHWLCHIQLTVQGVPPIPVP
ncbi:hypothetical protein B0H14DRAFT_3096063 [Mycena olivaceomarginata]|nr:hypothetical protein B0H14DRAFT_3096063 [Mycena olivaceomarginata]